MRCLVASLSRMSGCVFTFLGRIVTDLGILRNHSTLQLHIRLRGGMFNDSGDNSSTSELQQETIGFVDYKIPFNNKCPSVWFRQMECNFTVSNIRSDERKFMLAFPRLPQDISSEIPEDLKTYSELKKFILAMNEKSSQQKIEEALGTMNLEGRRPSQFVRNVTSKLRDIGLEPTEEILKHRLIKAMPENVRITLTASQSLPMTDFCMIADNLSDVMEGSVYQISTQRQSFNTYHRDEKNHGYNPRWQKSPIRSNNYSMETRGNHGYFPFHPDQRQKICRCHIYFGERAKRCKTWCKWPGSKPQIIDPDSATNSRNSSRSSSPQPSLK